MSGAFSFPVVVGTSSSDIGTTPNQQQKQTTVVSSPSAASFHHQVSEDEGSFTMGGSEPYTPQPVRSGVNITVDDTPSMNGSVSSPPEYRNVPDIER